MLGFAKSLFIEKKQKPFWKENEKFKFPLIEKACKKGYFSFVDLSLAKLILKYDQGVNLETFAFICHLSKAVRCGHVCVKYENGSLIPAPSNLWFTDEVDEIPGDILKLSKILEKKEPNLPQGIVSDVLTSESETINPICRFNNSYYFQKWWVFESLFIENLERVLKSDSFVNFDEKKLSLALDELTEKEALNDLQFEAVKKAFESPLSIICGGPGTGKTYTAGHFIQTYLKAMCDDDNRKYHITLAAPTGKAASQLKSSLEASFDLSNDQTVVVAKTLHSLLKMRKGVSFSYQSDLVLNPDLLVIDECSMIDAKVMSELFLAIKSGVKVLLLGDPYQLPSVEAGAFFSDLVKLKKLSGSITELKLCVRLENQQLTDFAVAVNQSDEKRAFDLLDKTQESSPVQRLFTIGEGAYGKDLQKKVLDHGVSHFRIPRFFYDDPEKLLKCYDKYRILSPLRKGFLGVDELNREFYLRLLSEARGLDQVPFPIIIVENDSKLDLFNGQVGVLMKSMGEGLENMRASFAIFEGGGNEGIRKVPLTYLPKYEFAFCLSVHKSQGSEFDRVHLLLPNGSEVFGKQVLYTACTRAKKRLYLTTNDEVFRKTLLNEFFRVSGVESRLSSCLQRLTS